MRALHFHSSLLTSLPLYTSVAHRHLDFSYQVWELALITHLALRLVAFVYFILLNQFSLHLTFFTPVLYLGRAAALFLTLDVSYRV